MYELLKLSKRQNIFTHNYHESKSEGWTTNLRLKIHTFEERLFCLPSFFGAINNLQNFDVFNLKSQPLGMGKMGGKCS